MKENTIEVKFDKDAWIVDLGLSKPRRYISKIRALDRARTIAAETGKELVVYTRHGQMILRPQEEPSYDRQEMQALIRKLALKREVETRKAGKLRAARASKGKQVGTRASQLS